MSTSLGFSLVDLATGEEVRALGSLTAPVRVEIEGVGVCDFDKVGQVMPDSEKPTHQVVRRTLVNEPPAGSFSVTGESVEFDGESILVSPTYVEQPEARRLVAKSLVLERLTDVQLGAAIALMTQRQKERWRIPGRPDIYVDDAELLSLLTAIGADAEVVLA